MQRNDIRKHVWNLLNIEGNLNFFSIGISPFSPLRYYRPSQNFSTSFQNFKSGIYILTELQRGQKTLPLTLLISFFSEVCHGLFAPLSPNKNLSVDTVCKLS